MRTELVEAARALSALGLVTAYGHVSARAGAGVLITPAADLGIVAADGLVEVPLDAQAVPPGAPAETWIHLALYRSRPDAVSIARAQPPPAFAAAAALSAGVAADGGKVAVLVPVHGQAVWLGEAVPVHGDARLLRTAELAAAAAAGLPAGEALLLRGNGAVTLGDSPGLAVARMWLLAAACETWLAAPSARPLSAAEIESWRAVGPELLPRLWAHLRRRTSTVDRSPA